jgi:hypothetical protein
MGNQKGRDMESNQSWGMWWPVELLDLGEEAGETARVRIDVPGWRRRDFTGPLNEIKEWAADFISIHDDKPSDIPVQFYINGMRVSACLNFDWIDTPCDDLKHANENLAAFTGWDGAMAIGWMNDSEKEDADREDEAYWGSTVTFVQPITNLQEMLRVVDDLVWGNAGPLATVAPKENDRDDEDEDVSTGDDLNPLSSVASPSVSVINRQFTVAELNRASAWKAALKSPMPVSEILFLLREPENRYMADHDPPCPPRRLRAE